MLVENFIKNSSLDSSLIIISSLGKDGTIGNNDLKELLDKVYGLSELNERYGTLLMKMRKKEISKEKIIFSYYSVLKDDPQLPFKLLPNDWLGDKVYGIIRQEYGNI